MSATICREMACNSILNHLALISESYADYWCYYIPALYGWYAKARNQTMPRMQSRGESIGSHLVKILANFLELPPAVGLVKSPIFLAGWILYSESAKSLIFSSWYRNNLALKYMFIFTTQYLHQFSQVVVWLFWMWLSQQGNLHMI